MNTDVAPKLAFDMKDVVSSQISQIGHHAESNTLAIRFASKGSKPGSLYHYSNFTADDFSALAAAPSTGSHFYAHVKPFKDRYPYVKVVEADPEQTAD